MVNTNFLVCILAFCMLVFSTELFALNGLQASTPAADGLIVKFKTNTSKSSQMHALSSTGLQIVDTLSPQLGLAHVRQLSGQNLVNSLNSITTNPNVVYAEPNYYIRVDATPTDPDFSQQWGLNNTGQTGGTAGADIKAPDAWDLQTGKDTVIAVIDTGIDYTHAELKNNVWVNSAEIPNNGIDEDNNGFIDDYYGWDFSSNDNDPMDDMGHGTHVAGIIAAEANNGIGISGINWRARIMGVKFIDANGVGTTSNAIKAINYAVAMGVPVSNNSWGGAGFSQALLDTLVAAEQAGHLFIAASGNNGTDSDDPAGNPHFPSSYPLDSIISVTASDHLDRKAGFANYGVKSVDLAAPGVKIRSLWLNNTYFELDGTSMAAPFVTGAAALLLSSRPDLTVAQIRSAILDNVDPVAEFAGITVTGGRLNLLKAISSITTNIALTPLERHISINDKIQFAVTGGSAPYQWQVTNSSVAQINSQTGLLQPLSVGITQVVVTDSNGVSARSNDIMVDQIVVSPKTASLSVGQVFRFVASGGIPPYQWQSTNPAVASINSTSGELFALSAGRTQVVVTDSNGLTQRSGDIEVIFIPDLIMAPQALSLAVGDSYAFKAQGGIPPYSWSSENPVVATIDSASGVLSAMSEGITRITVKDSTGQKTVSGDIEVISVQVSVLSNSMRINETQEIKVVGGIPPYEWRVSNSLVATIDNQGILTALTPGSIKVTLMDSKGHVAATDVILVTNSSALFMSIRKTIIGLNETLPITVSGGIKPYQWQASNGAVLAINTSSLIASGIGPGVSTITVIDALGERISSAPVEVREIVISPEVPAYRVGDQVQFVAIGGVAPYSWNVSSANVASINPSGLFIANNPGVVTVTATDVDGISGLSQTISISNGQATTHAFDVTPKTATLSGRSNSTLKFVASGGVEPYRFSLSNPGVGTIDPLTGDYNPKSSVPGDTTVVVTDADGHVTESGIIRVR